MLGFDSIKFSNKEQKIEINEVSLKDIAIIGMSAQVASAQNIDEFWSNIEKGVDCIRDFPKARERDAEEFLRHAGMETEKVNFFKGAYLEAVDKFDYGFFRLSPKEASLMSPTQRMFLETAWKTIEDAGYGGKKLVGSRTGVYIGFEADAPYDYKRFIAEMDPESVTYAVPGNLTPIIASRISYLLDLRGPSMSVDTACSSALVSIHLACQAIRNRECEMALAGSVRLNFLPIEGQLKLGIEAADGRAKTFDDNSDGTGSGEGVAAILLKPLSQAVKDGDNIYAVIKGSSVNQDGSSIGITAPNVLAQEDVIAKAWKDAEVEPETITYIEAHGTGTKLGDPIEIDGIQRAFRRFTDRKQFCAIGSIKTNIGHLDNAAGIAGLIKSVQALRTGLLPPSLHFNKPNSKISFEQSPVYVNDRLREWKTEGFPRRCGISSFGFSGTNCHVILEEYTKTVNQNTGTLNSENIFTLSAKSEDSLKTLVQDYITYLEKNKNLDIADVCYTANTGRGHYNLRIALMVKDIEDLKQKLRNIDFENRVFHDLYYGEHKIVPASKTSKEAGEFTENEIKEFTLKSEKIIAGYLEKGNNTPLDEVCKLYVKGGEINWEELYRGQKRTKVSLPVYAFERNRCWVEANRPARVNKAAYDSTGYSLLERQLVKSMNLEVYSTEFSAEKHWVLNEHRIMGNCVLVGTTYLEMVMQALKIRFGADKAEFKDIVFISPLVMNEGETREVQAVIRKESGGFAFEVVSRENSSSEDWLKHVEGKVWKSEKASEQKYEVENIKREKEFIIPDIDNYNNSTVFELGARWKNIRSMHVGDRELLSYIELPEGFRNELKDYSIYPSLLDNALTTMPLLQKINGLKPVGVEGSVYLPFSYGSLKLYKAIPASFYSYVRLNGAISDAAEVVSFDIALLDEAGEVFADIKDYSLKKMRQASVLSAKQDVSDSIFHQIKWVEKELDTNGKVQNEGTVIIIKDEKGYAEKVSALLREKSIHVITIVQDKAFGKTEKGYTAGCSQEDWYRLLNEIDAEKLSGILHFGGMICKEAAALSTLETNLDSGVRTLFHLIKAMQEKNLKQKINIALITEGVNYVTGEEALCSPENAALLGLGKVMGQELPNVKCRFIDIDGSTEAEAVLSEFYSEDKAYIAAYRKGRRYIEEFGELKIDGVTEPLQLKEQGIYLITGGMGGIGLEAAKSLTKRAKINLAMMNRTPMPERSLWKDILSQGTDRKMCNKIKAVYEIEEMGSRVELLSVDAANYESVKKAVDSLRMEYGRINGVIHGAGVAGDGFISNKEIEVFERVMAPKIKGAWILDKLTETDKPDFFILFSSVTTLAGAPGQSDYTAANAYLDAFQAYRNSKGRNTLTINWAGWKETGMAFDHGVNVDGIFKVMNTAEAVEAFEKVLNARLSQVYIGRMNYADAVFAKGMELGIKLSEDISAAVNKAAKTSNKTNKASTIGSDSSIVLKGRNDGSYTDMERKVALVWAQVLGYNEINIYDNFYELGGDSISMMNVISKMGECLGIEVSLKEFSSNNSVLELADFISSSGNGTKKEEKKFVFPIKTPDPTNMNVPFPLTDVQTAYLLGRDERFEMGGISTHAYLEIETMLEMGRFNRSLQKVIARHPMMRAIVLPNGEQQILSSVPEYKMEVLDLRHLDKESQDMLILNERNRMSHFVFKSDQWPLYEFKAFRLSDTINYLFIGFDVMIADAFSLQIIFKEILEYYNKPEMDMQEIAFSFRDYMLAYKEFKSSSIYSESKEYWLKKLEEFPAAPALPLKINPGDIKKPHFKRFRKVFDKNQWNRLKNTAKKNGVTPSALLCTVYASVLAYWSNQPKLSINLTVFNRYPFHEDINRIVGDFTSVILLGLNMEQGSDFWQKAKHVQETLMEALEHRHYDGVEFIRELSRHNNLGAKAVMPIVFTSMFFEMDENEEEPGIIKVGLTQTPQVYLDHQVTEKNGDLVVQWDYVEDLFDKWVIDTMFEQYTGIISELMLDNSEFRLLPPAEDMKLLTSYNATMQDIKPTTLHGMFMGQAARTPENKAVIFDEESLTYGELDKRSNQVARYLAEQGVGRNDLVGVMAKRSINTIVNVMGILKAGAAYVPVEPEYPEERRSYIMSNSNCKLMLEPTLYNDKNIHTYSWDAVAMVNEPEDLAYIIYTSGSTGRPKGVVITHGAAANTIIDINQMFNVGEKDRIMGISSMCFDLSVYDIFGSLGSGAALVLVKDQRDVRNLIETVEHQGVTLWNSVPAIMNMAMEHLDEDMVNSSLKLVMMSGDWIPLHLPDKIRKHCINAKVVSLGGATEASIWSIYYPVEEVRSTWKSIPYGIPMANQEFYVLDYEKRLCPVGVQGELYIGGVGLAQGYMNDEEKTRNAFITHQEFGSLYRTGDYGMMHREGYIEFLGRKDHQVKIRGFRIELGEIESCLLKHPAINNAVVIDRSDPNGKRYLCSYIVCEKEISAAELREFLLKALPDYMIPAYFIRVESIPLTPNGKVDRKALPEPDKNVDTGSGYVAPRNDIEKKLVDIWQKALELEKVGVNDNFFELGGTSLQIIDMHAQLDKQYPGKVKITDVFAFSTIAKLVELIGDSDKYKGLELKAIKMPPDYLTGDSAGYETSVVTFRLKADVVQMLKETAEDKGMEESRLLLITYLLLLAEESGQKEINIQSMLVEAGKVASLDISVEDIEDMAQFSKILGEKMKDGKVSYDVKDSKKLNVVKDSSSIIPLFHKKGLMPENISMPEVFDLVMEFGEDNDGIEFVCEFNNVRLQEEKMQEFVRKYMKLTNYMLKQGLF